MSSQQLQNILSAFQRQQQPSFSGGNISSNGSGQAPLTGSTAASVSPGSSSQSSLSNLSNLMQLIGRSSVVTSGTLKQHGVSCASSTASKSPDSTRERNSSQGGPNESVDAADGQIDTSTSNSKDAVSGTASSSRLCALLRQLPNNASGRPLSNRAPYTQQPSASGPPAAQCSNLSSHNNVSGSSTTGTSVSGGQLQGSGLHQQFHSAPHLCNDASSSSLAGATPSAAPQPSRMQAGPSQVPQQQQQQQQQPSLQSISNSGRFDGSTSNTWGPVSNASVSHAPSAPTSAGGANLAASAPHHLSRSDGSGAVNPGQFHYGEHSSSLHIPTTTSGAPGSTGSGEPYAFGAAAAGSLSSGTEQNVAPLAGSSTAQDQPLVVALGLIDSSLPPGSWQLDGEDIHQLMGCFGSCDWVKLLHSPAGHGQTPDCCIAQFQDPRVGYTMEKQLNGVVIPGIGKLSVVVIPSSVLTNLHQKEGSLEAFVSAKLLGTVTTTLSSPSATPPFSDMAAPVGGTGGGSSRSNYAPEESALSLLVQAIAAGEKSGGSLSGNSVAALVAALSAQDQGGAGRGLSSDVIGTAAANPSVLAALLQTQLQLLDTSSSSAPPPSSQIPPSSTVSGADAASAPLQAPVAPLASMKKLVCRLELVDLFGFHPEFDVPTLIVGADGSNIEYVLNEAKSKVDIDLDGLPVNEAPVAERLHLTVTALDQEAYTIAVETLEDLLQSICQQFAKFFVEKKGLPVPLTVGFRRHEYKEGSDGQLVYLGQSERPKLWLNKISPPSSSSSLIRTHL